MPDRFAQVPRSCDFLDLTDVDGAAGHSGYLVWMVDDRKTVVVRAALTLRDAADTARMYCRAWGAVVVSIETPSVGWCRRRSGRLCWRRWNRFVTCSRLSCAVHPESLTNTSRHCGPPRTSTRLAGGGTCCPRCCVAAPSSSATPRTGADRRRRGRSQNRYAIDPCAEHGRIDAHDLLRPDTHVVSPRPAGLSADSTSFPLHRTVAGRPSCEPRPRALHDSASHDPAATAR